MVLSRGWTFTLSTNHWHHLCNAAIWTPAMHCQRETTSFTTWPLLSSTYRLHFSMVSPLSPSLPLSFHDMYRYFSMQKLPKARPGIDGLLVSVVTFVMCQPELHFVVWFNSNQSILLYYTLSSSIATPFSGSPWRRQWGNHILMGTQTSGTDEDTQLQEISFWHILGFQL